MNNSFIKLHKEIIQLKSELHKRSLVSKEHHVEPKTVDKSVNDVLINVINKFSIFFCYNYIYLYIILIMLYGCKLLVNKK